VSIARSEAPLDALRDWETAGNGDTYLPGTKIDGTSLPAPDQQRAATVGGKPATVYSWSRSDTWFYVRWQPVDGLWAQVVGSGPDSTTEDALAVAAKLRLDQAYRCASPVRLPAVAAGSKVRLCEVTLWGAEHVDAKNHPTRLLAGLLLVGSGDGLLRVESGSVRDTTGQAAPNTEVGGHPARTFSNQLNQPAIEVFDVAGVNVTMAGTGVYTSGMLKTVASALVAGGDGRDPTTWPTPTIG
jgi:hypothetical protein